jgi:hypothetical protein
MVSGEQKKSIELVTKVLNLRSKSLVGVEYALPPLFFWCISIFSIMTTITTTTTIIIIIMGGGLRTF